MIQNKKPTCHLWLWHQIVMIRCTVWVKIKWNDWKKKRNETNTTHFPPCILYVEEKINREKLIDVVKHNFSYSFYLLLLFDLSKPYFLIIFFFPSKFLLLMDSRQFLLTVRVLTERILKKANDERSKKNKTTKQSKFPLADRKI